VLYWPDLPEQGVVVVLQVALPPRLRSPITARSPLPSDLAGSLAACLLMPGSHRAACAWQLPAPPAKGCEGSVCHRPPGVGVPAACHPLPEPGDLPRGREVPQGLASQSLLHRSLPKPCSCFSLFLRPRTSLCQQPLPLLSQQLLVAAGHCSVAALASSQQLRCLPLLLQWLLSHSCSRFPPLLSSCMLG